MSSNIVSESTVLKDENRIFASNPLTNSKFLSILILLLISSSAIFVFFAVTNDFENDEIKPLQEQHLLAQMKPEMEIKAKEGKEIAILWMAENYPNAEIEAQLDQLVLKNNPEALYLKYLHLSHFWNTAEQNENAIPYLVKAAEQGHPQAVRMLKTNNTPLKISYKEYYSRLIEYVF
ncbi:TPA: hypothetical protein ACGIK9_003371 [Acinetobacter baumannii]|uniref:hypothetical protein n=1 Tax=Acinetobacter baumannii TaxID=470 RepID=UPI00338F2729